MCAIFIIGSLRFSSLLIPDWDSSNRSPNGELWYAMQLYRLVYLIQSIIGFICNCLQNNYIHSRVCQDSVSKLVNFTLDFAKLCYLFCQIMLPCVCFPTSSCKNVPSLNLLWLNSKGIPATSLNLGLGSCSS